MNNHLSRPIISQDVELNIKNGRHLLQERTCQGFVPNDCLLGGTDHRVMVLTGPNSSGKSIFMKQTALIVYMAHLGSFIPADPNSRIGLVDRIYTRIQTREAIGKKTSAFESDLLQIKRALQGSTPRSLLLVDEFGKGTLAEDGIALLGGLIKYLTSMPLPPRSIAITHFHELYQMELLEAELPIKWCTMDICGDGPEATQIAFLFKVVSGKASTSLGLRCAQTAGIPTSIIERAKELVQLYSKGAPPATIRYSKMDPQMEAMCNSLLKLLVEGNPSDETTLAELRRRAQSLL